MFDEEQVPPLRFASVGMTVVRRALLALLPAMASSRALAQSVWYAVRGADHSFIVDMPGEPVYKLIDTASPGGTRSAVSSTNSRLPWLTKICRYHP